VILKLLIIFFWMIRIFKVNLSRLFRALFFFSGAVTIFICATHSISLCLSFRPVKVLARDRLAGALKSVVERDYASQVSLHYEHALVEADWQSEEVTLTFNTAGAGGAAGAPADDSSTSTSTDTSSNNDRSSTESSSSTMVVKAPFVVGADGAVRFVADKLAELEDPSYQQPQQKGQKEKGQELAATNGNGSGTSTSTSPSPSPSPSGGRPAPKAMARLAGRVGTKLARVMGRERPLRIVRYAR
jgi:hypothetical protein